MWKPGSPLFGPNVYVSFLVTDGTSRLVAGRVEFSSHYYRKSQRRNHPPIHLGSFRSVWLAASEA